MPQTQRGRPTKAQLEARKRKEALEKKRKQKQRVWSLVMFALGVFFIIFALVAGSEIWETARDVFFGLFGVCGYFVGPIMLLISVLLAYDKSYSKAQVVSAVVLALAVSGAFLTFSKGGVEGIDFTDKIKNLYLSGVNRTGGGVFSAVLGWSLLALCGRSVANIIIVLIIFVMLMIMTGKSILDLFEGARSLGARRREKKQEEQEMLELLGEDEPEPPKQTRAEAKKTTAEIYDIEAEEKKREQAKAKIDIPLGPEPPRNTQIDISIDDEPAIAEPALPRAQKPEPVVIDPEQTADTSEIVRRALAGEAFEKLDNRSKKEQTFETFAQNAEPEPDQELLIQKAAQKAAGGEPKLGAAQKRPLEEYKTPSASLLEKPRSRYDEKTISEELRHNAEFLVSTLESFGVATKIIDISRGPTVTRYELQPQQGVRLSRITNLADDIALNLATSGVRIEAPVPNKAAVGIEVPNKKKTMVYLRSVIESPEFQQSESPVTVALGKDISGATMVADIAKMPHLLIAGTTGSGKSKLLHSMLISLIYKSPPKDLRLILIDPKMVEFGVYNDVPHMMVPVVTDARKASGALGWAVGEMLKRYQTFSRNGVRDIEAYNRKVEDRTLFDFTAEDNEEDYLEPEKLPRIVVVIDELADLMMVAPNEVEDHICRLAQMARAAGIHLIVATQRPSVDVITGLIKANISSRIALAVSSQIDSRTIIDGAGAEKLLGNGDMLFRPMDIPKPVRIQGCFVSDDEVEKVTNYVKRYAPGDYDAEVAERIEELAVQVGTKGGGSSALAAGASDDADDMLEDAIRTVVEAGAASTSLLQRKLKLGYARAARIMDEMEEMGIVGPPEGSKPRAVKMTRQQYLERSMGSAGLEPIDE